ncbi:MAG TPA: ribosome maturation factor RimM [Candidatus Dormibacteraeota bacterium]|nr:ribosome maturation factor RimM [Candidatus Dormibacteraeota bacterium]
MPADSPSRVTLARILRARGLRGEVAAEILTDFPERLTKLPSAFLWDGHGEPRLVRVRKCWLTPSRGGQAVFHFEGINAIEQAEQLRGLEVQVPFEERVQLPQGRYYVSELIGCEVFERGGLEKPLERIGEVRDVQFTGAAPLLAVPTSRGDLLIPLAEEICTGIDVQARRIEVVLPEGLRDLNP